MGTASDLFFGLSTAFGYGTGDFVARGASHRLGSVRVLFYMEALSLLVLFPIAAVFEGDRWRLSSGWGLVVFLGVVNVFASLFLYRSFEFGVLSVVSPLVSGYPAVTAALAIVFLGDRPPASAMLGIVAALSGVVLISRSGAHPAGPPPKDPRRGLVSAALSFCGYGVFYFAMKYAVDDIGPVSAAAWVRVVGVGLMLLASLGGVVDVRGLRRTEWVPLAFIGLMDVVGFIAYDVGIQTGSVAIIGTLSGLFSAVTVGLAALLLKERLTRWQYAGMAAIFVGVVLMALR